MPKRSGTLPPPPPVLNMPSAGDRSEVRPDGGRLAGRAIRWMHTALTGSMSPTSVTAGQRLQNLVAADLAEPVTVPRVDPRGPTVQVEARTVKEQSLAVPIGPGRARAAGRGLVGRALVRRRRCAGGRGRLRGHRRGARR